MIQGAFSLACLNKSLTRLAPTPTNISTKSLPDIEKNGTLASPATALANNVFPVPGGPTSNTPLGIFPPREVYFFGFLRKSTISIISSLASSNPATSAKVKFTLESFSNNCAFDLPMLNICEPGPPAPPLTRRIRKKYKAMKMMGINKYPKIVPITLVFRSNVNSTRLSAAKPSLILSNLF